MCNKHRLYWCLVCVAGIAIALPAGGCGKGDGKRTVYPVTGKVLIDGQPGSEARLFFSPTNEADTMAPKPTAVTDSQGNLIVTTYVTGDGAPEGEYKIGLEWPKMVNYFGRIQPGPDRLGGKYKDVAASKWTIRITAGTNSLPDFDIKTK
jgi:hypothetical protein